MGTGAAQEEVKVEHLLTPLKTLPGQHKSSTSAAALSVTVL